MHRAQHRGCVQVQNCATCGCETKLLKGNECAASCRAASGTETAFDRSIPAVTSCPVPSCPVPSRPVPSRPVPSRPVPSRPVPSCPVPFAPLTSPSTSTRPTRHRCRDAMRYRIRRGRANERVRSRGRGLLSSCHFTDPLCRPNFLALHAHVHVHDESIKSSLALANYVYSFD